MSEALFEFAVLKIIFLQNIVWKQTPLHVLQPGAEVLGLMEEIHILFLDADHFV